MLPIFMIQSQVFWLRGKPLRNIQPFNGFAPMQDIERLLNKMFPKNSALVLILLHARKLDGRFYLSGGSWSVLWPGSTIPAVFPKTMKCLSVLHKLFAPLLLSALYSSGFSLLVQLLRSCLNYYTSAVKWRKALAGSGGKCYNPNCVPPAGTQNDM